MAAKSTQEPPTSLRFNDEDKTILAYLQERMGLKLPQVLKLAIRRLQEQEKRAERSAQK